MKADNVPHDPIVQNPDTEGNEIVKVLAKAIIEVNSEAFKILAEGVQAE